MICRLGQDLCNHGKWINIEYWSEGKQGQSPRSPFKLKRIPRASCNLSLSLIFRKQKKELNRLLLLFFIIAVQIFEILVTYLFCINNL